MGVSALLTRRRAIIAQPHLANKTGLIVSANDAMHAPLQSAKALIGHDANGLTGLSLWRVGRNCFDAGSVTYKNGAFLNDQGNEQSSSGGSGYITSYTAVAPGTTYTFSGTISDSSVGWRIYFFTKTKGWIRRTSWIAPPNPAYTFTTPDNCYYISFQYGSSTVQFNTFQVELGSAKTNLTSYNGEEYVADWSDVGPVYGGSFDFVSGVLISEYAQDGTPLENPVTYRLTPQQILPLTGETNIWNDAGLTAISYWTH